jgi:ribosomal protein S18 acetylase RimI-like enzyme
MQIRRCTPADLGLVVASGHLFDEAPKPDWTQRFLTAEGHHLLLAFDDSDDTDVADAAHPLGFVSGMEIHHPDKATELLLYELAVDDRHRRRGVGRALVEAMLALAAERGCRGMWVPLEPDDEHYSAALATYLSAGATRPAATAICEWHLS